MLSACFGKSRPGAYWSEGTHPLPLGLAKELPATSLLGLVLTCQSGQSIAFYPSAHYLGYYHTHTRPTHTHTHTHTLIFIKVVC